MFRDSRRVLAHGRCAEDDEREHIADDTDDKNDEREGDWKAGVEVVFVGLVR